MLNHFSKYNYVSIAAGACYKLSCIIGSVDHSGGEPCSSWYCLAETGTRPNYDSHYCAWLTVLCYSRQQNDRTMLQYGIGWRMLNLTSQVYLACNIFIVSGCSSLISLLITRRTQDYTITLSLLFHDITMSRPGHGITVLFFKSQAYIQYS